VVARHQSHSSFSASVKLLLLELDLRSPLPDRNDAKDSTNGDTYNVKDNEKG